MITSWPIHILKLHCDPEENKQKNTKKIILKKIQQFNTHTHTQNKQTKQKINL